MNKRFFIIPFALLVLAALALSCNTPFTTPRKKGYFKIDFPEKKYQLFNEPGYPYSFEYPVYGNVTKDTSFFDQKAGDYWINVDFPRFAGRIYISYVPVTNNLDKLVDDGYKMAFKKHTEVATGINDQPIHTPNGIGGVYFSLTGNTATANQFFVTDSSKHFLRGALYFNAAPNEDSLSIVNDFLKKDLEHLINTLQWK